MCVVVRGHFGGEGSVLFFHIVGPKDQTQVTRLGSKLLYQPATLPALHLFLHGSGNLNSGGGSCG